MLKLSRPAAEVFIPAAVIVTDGRGSNTRLMEQKRAASQGNDAVMARFVYTHNPVDFSHTSCVA